MFGVVGANDYAHYGDTVQAEPRASGLDEDVLRVRSVEAADGDGGDGEALFREPREYLADSIWSKDILGVCFAAVISASITK